MQTFEGAERDRSIAFANKFNQTESGKLVREKFGVEMKIPKGYILAQQSDDFLWFRYEFPAASQGFMLYSYPYEGKQSFRRRRCWLPATVSPPAFRGRATAPI